MKLFRLATVVLAALFVPVLASAGTLSPGVQAWYVSWQSGMAQLNADIIEAQLRQELDAADGDGTFGGNINGYSLDVGNPEGSGFIFGPALRYETDDRLWEFNLSIMWFGAYTTNIDTSFILNVTGISPLLNGSIPFKVSSELEIDHRDIDLRARRKITDAFSAFVGYKYQSYETSIGSHYNINYGSTINFASNLDFSFFAEVHMPYAGVGYSHPFGSAFSLAANLGLGVPIGGRAEKELSINGTDYSENFDIKMAWAVMGDISLVYVMGSSVELRLGYQYQRFTLRVENIDIDQDGQSDDSGDYVDVFQGVTFAALYRIGV
ncbi:MAG TPA: hypothetical protein PKY31_15330 [Spirochaetota bacterium]|nr:hypothetical protein [Spirochaetota bacterium]